MGRSRWIEALRFEEQLEKEALRRGKPFVMARPERPFPEIEKRPSWIGGSASFGGAFQPKRFPARPNEALWSGKIGFNKALRFSGTEITKCFVPERLGMAGAPGPWLLKRSSSFLFWPTRTVPGSNGKRFIARAE